MQLKILERIKTKVTTYTNLLLIILCIIFALSLVRNIGKIKKVADIIDDKKQRLEKLKKDNEELQSKLEQVKSQVYIEKQLRDSLGLARPGEIVVVLPDKEILKSLAPKFEEEEDVLPDPNWKKWAKTFGLNF